MGDNSADVYMTVGQLSALTSDIMCDAYILITVLIPSVYLALRAND